MKMAKTSFGLFLNNKKKQFFYFFWFQFLIIQKLIGDEISNYMSFPLLSKIIKVCIHNFTVTSRIFFHLSFFFGWGINKKAKVWNKDLIEVNCRYIYMSQQLLLFRKKKNTEKKSKRFQKRRKTSSSVFRCE